MKAPKEMLKKAMQKGHALHFEIHLPMASGELKKHEMEEGPAHEKGESKAKERREDRRLKKAKHKKSAHKSKRK